MRTAACLLVVCALACMAAAAAPSPAIHPQEGTIPLVIEYEGGPSTPDARWTFGDGQSAGGARGTHTYARIGRYPLQLVVGKTVRFSGEVRARLERSVTVASNGGGAEIAFDARRGQKVRISMRALSGVMEPYGNLESSGGSNYRPAAETARNGGNQWEGTLTDDGRHVLTVFDGSNQGGTILVTIEEP